MQSKINFNRNGPAGKSVECRAAARHSGGNANAAHVELQEALREQMTLVMDAEGQIASALAAVSNLVTAPELRRIIDGHLQETRVQARRLKRATRAAGGIVKSKHCVCVRQTIREMNRLCRRQAWALRDACIAAHLQQIEHYEISAYNTLCAWSKACGAREIIVLCTESLAEEKKAAESLSRISETVLLPNALWSGSPFEKDRSERSHMPIKYDANEYPAAKGRENKGDKAQQPGQVEGIQARRENREEPKEQTQHPEQWDQPASRGGQPFSSPRQSPQGRNEGENRGCKDEGYEGRQDRSVRGNYGEQSDWGTARETGRRNPGRRAKLNSK